MDTLGAGREKPFPLIFLLARTFQQRLCLINDWVGGLLPGKGSQQFHLQAGDGGPESVNAVLGARRLPCSTQMTKPSGALRSCDLPSEEGGLSLAGWSNARLHSYILTPWDSQFKPKVGQPARQMQTAKSAR